MAKFLVFSPVTFIHSFELNDLKVVEDAAIVVDKNTSVITDIFNNSSEIDSDILENSQIIDITEGGTKKRFICPGFVDTHTHAAQYSFSGTGHGLTLLDWLNTYTFPAEAKLSDPKHAVQIFSSAVKRFLKNGTTTGCYFACIDVFGSLILAECLRKIGQRSFVGKVSMDRNSPDFYIEDKPDQSIKQATTFVNNMKKICVQPIITPRFVPTCSSKLMKELADLAQSNNLLIQTHLSENSGEISWVESLHSECKNYTDVYFKHNLLSSKTIMAHCLHLNTAETKTGISHCPNSNFNLSSGLFPIRDILSAGIPVGLGTDVAGGSSPSMLDAMRSAMNMSFAQSIKKTAEKPDGAVDQPINYKEAFYLATMGGANILGLGNEIGNFVVGKSFDCLIIDPVVDNSPFDIFPSDSTLDIFQKFLFLGDDRNIVSIYIKGKEVLSNLSSCFGDLLITNPEKYFNENHQMSRETFV